MIYFKLVRGTAVQVSAARLDPKAAAINDGCRKVQATLGNLRQLEATNLDKSRG